MIFSNVIPDIRGMFSDLRIPDLAPLFFALLWMISLVISLRGVDRRDEIAHVTYVCVMLAIGVVMFFGLPFGSKAAYSESTRLILFLALVIFPSLRWIFEKKRTIADGPVSKQQSTKKG